MTRGGECYIGDDDGGLSMVALFDTQKAVERLRGSGVAEDQAAATVEMVAEATDELATKDYLREQLLLLEARQRAELYRALLFASLIIIGTMTAITAALTQL